jgi:hypothetical protein
LLPLAGDDVVIHGDLSLSACDTRLMAYKSCNRG